MADNEEQFEVKGPGGMGFAFKGREMFPVILLVLLGAFCGFMTWQADSKSEARDAATHKAISEFKEATMKADETQQAMIYVLSLPQAEREKLNLMKPRGLTAMQR